MKRATWLSSLLFVSLLAMVVVPAVLAGANSQITLKPSNRYPTATGTAQYQSQPGQRELQIEVEHLRGLAGQSLSIYVGGSKIGAARVNSRGVAELARNSELAQRVPSVAAGTAVAVRTSRAVTILSGTF
jgi:predicted PilT family ATPase